MISESTLWSAVLLFIALPLRAYAAPPSQSLQARAPTCNTATNRQCWTTSPSFNINTDYEASWPTTGVTTRTV